MNRRHSQLHPLTNSQYLHNKEQSKANMQAEWEESSHKAKPLKALMLDTMNKLYKKSWKFSRASPLMILNSARSLLRYPLSSLL